MTYRISGIRVQLSATDHFDQVDLHMNKWAAKGWKLVHVIERKFEYTPAYVDYSFYWSKEE